MGINSESRKNKFEIIKWILIVLLVIMAILGNYYFRQMIAMFRIFLVFFLLGCAFGIGFLTIKGKAFVLFVREAKIEMRKVIWPSCQETLQVTLIVIGVSFIMSLILWGLDAILVQLISFITSLRF